MSDSLEVKGLPGAAPVVQQDPPKVDPPKPAEVEEKSHEETVPYERFQKANQTARQAKEQIASLKSEMAQLREQFELKANGASDAEQLQRRLERAEERAQKAEQEREEARGEALNTRKERWVSSAAAAQNFTDPSDASVFLDLSEIETEKDAERAIKRLAQSKKYLVKPEERQLPGKVMEGGKPVQPQQGGLPNGLIDPMQDASTLVEGLVRFASPEAQEAWRQQHNR